MTFNQVVRGSRPRRPTTFLTDIISKKWFHNFTYPQKPCVQFAYKFNPYHSLPGNGNDITETREFGDFLGVCLNWQKI